MGLRYIKPSVMKTTLDIDDALLRRAKARALERGTTLRAVVEEALQRSLGSPAPVHAPLKLITWPASPASRVSEEQVLAAIRSDRDAAAHTPAHVGVKIGVAASRRRLKKGAE
jgi:Arc/MetJ family transcription regulator